MSLHLVSIKSIRDITKDAVAVGILEAYKRFGESSIERWKRDGLIKPQRTGAKANNTLTYSVTEIAEAKMAESIQMALLPPPVEKKA